MFPLLIRALFPFTDLLWGLFLQPPPVRPGGTGGGGGGSGGGGSSSGGPYTTPIGENGGFYATAQLLFVPTQSVNGGQNYISYFNPNQYNDPVDGGFYSYRMEDVIVGRQPTVHREIVVYRDYGPATITITISGTNDIPAPVSNSAAFAIGTAAATGTLMTLLAYVSLTAFRPQLTITYPPNSPVSIVSVTMLGEVEEVVL